MPIISLVYVSFASRPMSEQDLVDILTVARAFNATQNITGMLLYRDRYFIQVLEGETTAVETLYAKIQQDERHSNILTVEKVPIETRSFESWSMGFRNLDAVDATQYVGFSDFLLKPVPPDHFEKNPSHAKKLLLSFKDELYF